MQLAPIPCTVLLSYLRECATRPAGALPLPIARHVQACDLCRARLYMLFSLLGVADHEASACGPCIDDLAAFVEHERRNPLQAMQWYPAVWSHLWSCGECLEHYDLLHSMAHDPQLRLADHALTFPGVPMPALDTLLVHIYPATLHATIPAQPRQAMRAQHLPQQRTYEIVDVPASAAGLPACRVVIHAQEGETWQLEVQLTPPAASQLGIRIAEYADTSPVDASGTARLPIPDRYLTAAKHSGIDIMLLSNPVPEV